MAEPNEESLPSQDRFNIPVNEDWQKELAAIKVRTTNAAIDCFLKQLQLLPPSNEPRLLIDQGFSTDDIFEPTARLELALQQLEQLEEYYRVKLERQGDSDVANLLDRTQRVIGVLKQVEQEADSFKAIRRHVSRSNGGTLYSIDNTIEALTNHVMTRDDYPRGQPLSSVSVQLIKPVSETNERPIWSITVNGSLWGFSDGPFFR